ALAVAFTRAGAGRLHLAGAVALALAFALGDRAVALAIALALAFAVRILAVALAFAGAAAGAAEAPFARSIAGAVAGGDAGRFTLAFALGVALAGDFATLALDVGFARLHRCVALARTLCHGIDRRRALRRNRIERDLGRAAELGSHFAHHLDGRFASVL